MYQFSLGNDLKVGCSAFLESLSTQLLFKGYQVLQGVSECLPYCKVPAMLSFVANAKHILHNNSNKVTNQLSLMSVAETTGA